jgi:hypothetical protein
MYLPNLLQESVYFSKDSNLILGFQRSANVSTYMENSEDANVYLRSQEIPHVLWYTEATLCS